MNCSDTSPKIALVTGATGAVGPALVALLLEEGYQVRTLTRQPPATDCLPPGVEIRLGDITQPADVAAAVAGSTLVFHLAAKLHINNPSAQSQADYQRVNVGGTEALVQAAIQNQVQRLIFFSTINVYAGSNSAVVREHSTNGSAPLLAESSEVGPDTLYGKSKQEAEAVALAAKRVDGQPLATVLRLAAVYGPHMVGNYRRLWQMVRRGFYPKIGNGENRRTLIHEEDVAQATLLAATAERAAGQIYNLTDGSVYTLNQVVKTMADTQNRRVWPLSLPLPVARAGATLLALAWSARGRHAPIGSWTVDKLIEDIAVSGIKIQQELGFKPRYTLLEGWQTLIK